MELSDGFILHQGPRLAIAPEMRVHHKHVDAVPAAREAVFHTRPRKRLAGACVFITSPGYQIYGHWLVDILPRLALLEAAGFHPDGVWYPVPSNIPRFALELLGLCGVPASRIVVYSDDEVIRPDQLLMPTLMHNGVRFSPMLREAVALFRRALQAAGHVAPVADAPARILLARRGNNRRMLNREPIEALAQKAGFVIVQPETMSLPEQIALFSSTREIIGEYGSAFHTAIFSRSDTLVCGLRGSQQHPGFIQSGIGEVLDQPTGYVFGTDGGTASSYDFSVAEDDFADCLRLVFGLHRSRKTEPVSTNVDTKIQRKLIEPDASAGSLAQPRVPGTPRVRLGFWRRVALLVRGGPRKRMQDNKQMLESSKPRKSMLESLLKPSGNGTGREPGDSDGGLG